MNTKAEQTGSPLDTGKLIVAAAVLLTGIWGYYYFAEESVLLRAIGVLVAFIIGSFVAFQSAQGQQLWKFIQGSRVELRKVVWPTRQEAVQTTVAVLIFALMMGVFFWLLDMFLLWVTQVLTGKGG
jgi:preprotein translocase subunit SecE